MKHLLYDQALKVCKKSGTAHATGDALCAMYAGLIALQHGGLPNLYYEWLYPCKNDDEIADKARELLRDREKAWDVLMI